MGALSLPVGASKGCKHRPERSRWVVSAAQSAAEGVDGLWAE